MNLNGIAKQVSEGKTLDASIAKELRRAVREGSRNEIDRADHYTCVSSSGSKSLTSR